ncbi:hypothetical protein ABGV17_04340 [Guyparkeria sp. GHLCS8-2]|uniref:hypothetical protein n=1 Tax=Guyparkeria halopsychrophila TaxID=3139421 RepID=UPI0037C607DA
MREVLTRREIRYQPSRELEREAQEAERNNRRLRAFYARRRGTPVLPAHWYLFHKRPGSGRSE